MKISYELFIALRYLKAKKKQTLISVITLISTLGITLGVSALIIVLAVMNGFNSDLRSKILGVKSHITISGIGGSSVSDYPKIMNSVQNMEHITGIAPYVIGQVILKAKSYAEGIVVWGIDPDLEPKVTNINNNLKKGTLDMLALYHNGAGLVPSKNTSIPGIILGAELAKRFGIRLGDDVLLMSPSFITSSFGMIPKVSVFKVSGIFESGMYEYDSTFAYIHILAGQKLFNMKDTVSGIAVKLDDIYAAQEVAKKIRMQFAPDYTALDWMQMNKNLFYALKLEKVVMAIILTLIILIAVFNILSSLIMTVMEKTKGIGILKAMGVPNKSILKIFIYQGIIIGIIGTILGSILGIGLSIALDKYHFIKLSGDVYYITNLPVQMKISDILLVVFSSVILSFLATIYPAYKASKLDPVEAIRYE